MASSPSTMPGRSNRPGCMSGITHLFDFNQAIAGRKLLTDKNYGTGAETQRKILDGNAGQFISRTGSGEKLEFVKNKSMSRRSVDVPIKALMAEDVSHELGRAEEPRRRTPSVVARLMGLDALPCDSAGQSRKTGELENSVQKVHSDRLQHGKVPTLGGSSRVSKNGPPMRSVSDLSACRRSSWEEHTPVIESLSTGSRLHEQELKVAPDQQAYWKPGKCAQMQALDDLDMQLAVKQMLIKKKLSEAKLGFLAKNNGPQEKLYESREFMDAMDFLQANKDFFARFLEEPNPLVPKHLRGSDGNSSQGKVEELRKHSKQYAVGAPEQGIATQIKGPPDLWRNPQREFERSSQIDERVSTDAYCQQERFLKTQHKHAKTLKYLVSKGDESQQAPTRIVVLKPGPGKVRNLRSLTQSRPRSPKGFLDAIETVKENSVDVLCDLRCKLQQDDARDLNQTWTSVTEHSKLVRDPREIARQIARQVRENVMKDMKAKVKGAVVSEIDSDSNQVPSEILNVEGSGFNTNHEESSNLQTRDPTREIMSGFSRQLLDKKRSPNRGKGESRRSLDQVFLEKSVAQTSASDGVSNKRGLRLHDCGCPRKQGGQLVEGTGFCEVNLSNTSNLCFASETDMDCETDSCTQSLCDSEADVYARNESVARITLLRSKSVPTNALFGSNNLEKKGLIQDRTLPACETTTAEAKRSCDLAIHKTGSFEQSVLKRKHLGSKGALSKGNTSIKGSEKTFISALELTKQKFDLNVGSRHDKMQQHQIDDLGPVLDSDSSVSSPDDCLTLEAALLTGGIGTRKIPERSTCMQTINGNSMPRKAKILSPEESPGKSLSSTDLEHISAHCEASKDLPEQPSPVSVLDASFPEELASPMDFTEIGSGLQELGARVQALKFSDREADSVLIQQKYQEDSELIEETKSARNHTNNQSNNIEDVNSLVDGIMCHKERIQELIYVEKLLIASGFTTDSAMVFTQWHSPSQPLATCVFEEVENGYKCESSDAILKECKLSVVTRHLLFDTVNELLLQLLGPFVNNRNWWKYPRVPSNMPLGENLVEQVWSRLYKLLCLHSEDQDTLGSSVAEDLVFKDRWQDFSLELEIIIVGVDKAIWNDILEDAVQSYQ